MPTRAPRPCRKRGCPTLSRDGSGYCTEHKTEDCGWFRTSTKSRHERGYGHKWVKIRKRILTRDRYLCQCQDCKDNNRLTPATEVDHIIPKSQGGTDHPDNLQAISRDCHKAKTRAEAGKAQSVKQG